MTITKLQGESSNIDKGPNHVLKYFYENNTKRCCEIFEYELSQRTRHIIKQMSLQSSRFYCGAYSLCYFWYDLQAHGLVEVNHSYHELVRICQKCDIFGLILHTLQPKLEHKMCHCRLDSDFLC
jgi:hypothetical protein